MTKGAILRVGLLVAAIALITAGFVTGDYMNVYFKAIKLCFECIGIG